MQPIFFITGIGTGVGKTLAASILTEALRADYWKPVQAGFAEGTDTETLQSLISNPVSVFHPEMYRLPMPASPHIAARNAAVTIDLDAIADKAKQLAQTTGTRPLLIEGAGGLLVPLTEQQLIADLVEKIGAQLIIVSRNYLGSINHSLLTAAYCKNRGLPVAGWIFTDQYLDYENEIVELSGYPSLGRIPFMGNINADTVLEQANLLIQSGIRQRLSIHE
ncbi:MAG: dethiobiotin synthase [Bacteroidota bacterium]|nr:dethiobiotin synthase [Bacteroidota bacterium]